LRWVCEADHVGAIESTDKLRASFTELPRGGATLLGEEGRMQPKRATPSRRRGLRVVGPGFYLWDPDVREALRLAADLIRRPVPLTRPRRSYICV
jgi:hypothetical protein